MSRSIYCTLSHLELHKPAVHSISRKFQSRYVFGCLMGPKHKQWAECISVLCKNTWSNITIWQDYLTEADTRAGRYEPGVTMSTERGGGFKSSSASEGGLVDILGCLLGPGRGRTDGPTWGGEAEANVMPAYWERGTTEGAGAPGRWA